MARAVWKGPFVDPSLLKKIGKLIRKIMVNFESKLPIEKIILFYGIGNFKERLLLYLKW